MGAVGLTRHVEEERRTIALLGLSPLALDRHLSTLFTVLAPDGKRQRTQPLVGNFTAAVGTVAVGAFVEPVKRVVDLGERFRLHLNQRKLDIFLNIRF